MENQRNILLIERSASQAVALQAMLEEHNFNVKHVSCFNNLRSELDQSANFFLAITNLELSDTDSAKILDLLLGRDIVTLVFTASVSPELRKMVSERPIADYIVKSGPHALERVLLDCDQIWKNKNLNLLIVDDSPSSNRLMEHVARNQGFNVATVETSEAALAHFEKNKVDIAVIDYILPGADGVSCCKKLREQFSHEDLAIIGVSVNDQSQVPVNYLKAGADDFIKKPFSPEEFICRINKIAAGVTRSREIGQQMENSRFVLRVMGHDIRTPLNVFRLAFRRLNKALDLDSSQTQLSEMINNSIRQMNSLVEACLFFCRLSADENVPLEAVDVHDILVETQKNMMPIAMDHNVVIVVTNCSTPKVVNANPFLLAQTLQNLVSNALKFSPENGMVELRADLAEDAVDISVVDQGPGIPKASREELFRAFSKLSSLSSQHVSSFGLGLSIVKQAVTAMDGEIKYQDNKPQGAIFTVSLNRG